MTLVYSFIHIRHHYIHVVVHGFGHAAEDHRDPVRTLGIFSRSNDFDLAELFLLYLFRHCLVRRLQLCRTFFRFRIWGRLSSLRRGFWGGRHWGMLCLLLRCFFGCTFLIFICCIVSISRCSTVNRCWCVSVLVLSKLGTVDFGVLPEAVLHVSKLGQQKKKKHTKQSKHEKENKQEQNKTVHAFG